MLDFYFGVSDFLPELSFREGKLWFLILRQRTQRGIVKKF